MNIGTRMATAAAVGVFGGASGLLWAAGENRTADGLPPIPRALGSSVAAVAGLALIGVGTRPGNSAALTAAALGGGLIAGFGTGGLLGAMLDSRPRGQGDVGSGPYVPPNSAEAPEYTPTWLGEPRS